MGALGQDEHDDAHEALRAWENQRCSVLMSNNVPCGRAIEYWPSPGVDAEPACLMHSHDSQKSDAEFQKEFERILREAGENLADFMRFVFPGSSYPERDFGKCDFTNVVFTHGATFWGARFRQDVSFEGAKFEQHANFLNARFLQKANFKWAQFAD